MKRILWLWLMVAMGLSTMAQRATISGTVTDKVTGETMIGATVMDVRSGKGTVTNGYGFYSLTLEMDSVELRVSYVGYKVMDEKLLLTGTVRRNFQLSPSIELKEVVITADKVGDHKSSQISAIDVPIEKIKAVPVLMGETDILKALQLMPGVQSGGEGMSGMYVRGGGPDENLFLLDGVPMYNVNHLGGFFSAFNSDAVKNVTLYKGGFPARFGGRISSVVDVAMNDGNMKRVHGSVNVGLISAKLSVEGPIVKDKTTFSVSARRTYADILMQPALMILSKMDDEMGRVNGGYYFYDLNAKVTHKFSDRSRLYGSFYMGDDAVYMRLKMSDEEYVDGMGYENSYLERDKLNYRWGNIVGTLRWNYELTPKMFMNVTGSYTQYRNNIGMSIISKFNDEHDSVMMNYNSGIRDMAVRVDFDYAPNPNHSVKFGANMTHHIFSPEVASYRESYDGDVIQSNMGQNRVHAEEMNMYVEDDWSIVDALKVNVGARVSGFAVEGKFYPSIEPRVSGRWLISEDWSMKVGYAYMTQYMHLLSNSGISLPTDLWVPVTKRIAPVNAHQVAAGVMYSLKGLVDFSVEGYYKRMDNLMEYREGASLFGSSVGWEDKVCLGEGWAYGVEFLVQKQIGDFTGWVGYTWSKTERLFDRVGEELNFGKVFPARYDRRHDVSVVLMYKPNERFDCSLSWVYSTGNAVTLALQQYDGSIPRVDGEDFGGGYTDDIYNHIEQRNNYRMPDYHRMDVSVNFHKQKRHGVRTWNISIYNLYNRKNPYMIYPTTEYESGGTNQNKLMQVSLFPIIPSVSYIYKF